VKKFGLTVTNLTHLESIESVQRAVDNKFQRLINHARAQWEQRFAGVDPSDASVSVRIIAAPEAPARQPVPRCGFVNGSKKTERRSNICLPRFAQ
jgi:hypothetical protein